MKDITKLISHGRHYSSAKLDVVLSILGAHILSTQI